MALVRVQEGLGSLVRYVLTPLLLPLVERNWLPDYLIRLAIGRELAMELARVKKLTSEQQMEKTMSFVAELKTLPIAIEQVKANEQHYEVPDEFFQLVLGPCFKYSSGYWPNPNTTLAESEVEMLELYCQRAGLEDGMALVDLGCGWGSVTLYMANKYPNSKITSISNSNSQRKFIMDTAEQRGLRNVTVFTGDITKFDLPQEFHNKADRVISIEMFEHMKNYELLMQKVSTWLKPGGKLFLHIFTNKDVPDHYKEGWMTDNFFTGGTLPSDTLLLYFQKHLRIEGQWRINGKHYQKTLEAWLVEMDSKKSQVMPILTATYGADKALKWFVNWRLFFIGCAEFFGFADGEEYFVSHYLFCKPM